MMRPSVQGVDPPVCCVLDVAVTYARDSFVDSQAGPFVLSRGGAQISWHQAYIGILFLIFLLTILYRFSSAFRSGEFAGQSSTPTPRSFNQLLMLLAVWAGAKSC